jgi:hypothetical protein
MFYVAPAKRIASDLSQVYDQLLELDVQISEIDKQLLEDDSLSPPPDTAAPASAINTTDHAIVGADPGAQGDLEMAEAPANGNGGSAVLQEPSAICLPDDHPSADSAPDTAGDSLQWEPASAATAAAAAVMPVPADRLSHARLLALSASPLLLHPSVMEHAVLATNRVAMQDATERLLRLLPDNLAERVRFKKV